jgi:hypothetical protein
VLSPAELTSLAIGPKPTGSSLDVVENLELVERVLYVFSVVLVLLTDVRVFKEVLVLSFEDTFFAVIRVVPVYSVRYGRRLDNWPEEFEYSLLDLSWGAVGIEEDDPGLS